MPHGARIAILQPLRQEFLTMIGLFDKPLSSRCLWALFVRATLQHSVSPDNPASKPRSHEITEFDQIILTVDFQPGNHSLRGFSVALTRINLPSMRYCHLPRTQVPQHGPKLNDGLKYYKSLSVISVTPKIYNTYTQFRYRIRNVFFLNICYGGIYAAAQ